MPNPDTSSSPPDRKQPRGGRRLGRPLLTVVGSMLAGLGVVVALLPWWLGGLLAAAGRSEGVTFGHYERMSYSRFALSDVEVERPGVHLEVDRVEADNPLIWLWRRMTGVPGDIQAGNWSVDVAAPAGADGSASGEDGWRPLQDRARTVLARLIPWVPSLRADAGMMRWPGGEVALDGLTWQGRTLDLQGVRFRDWRAEIKLKPESDGSGWQLEVRSPEGNFAATAETRDADVTGSLTWRGQTAQFEAAFAAAGWLPDRATLTADDWTLPAEALRLGSDYREVRGGVHLEWAGNAFTTSLEATGVPTDATGAPPLQVAVQGRGDLRSLQLDTVNVTIPGLHAELEQPVKIDRDGQIEGGDAAFTFRADLSEQPWFSGAGTVDGRATLSRGPAGLAAGSFTLSARDLRLGDHSLARLDSAGTLDWPRLQVTSGTAELTDGDRLEFTGGWDLTSAEVRDGMVSGSVGSSTLSEWIPGGTRFERADFVARFSGPPNDLEHSGTVDMQHLQYGRLNELTLTGGWQGRGTDLQDFEGGVVAGGSSVQLAGSLAGGSLHLRRLEWTPDGAAPLTLTAPVDIRWNSGFSAGAFRLESTAGSSVAGRVDWGPTGQLELTANSISSAWINDLANLPGPSWEVASVDAKLAWDQGPLTGTVRAAGTVSLEENQVVDLTAMAQFGTDGLDVRQLQVRENGTDILTASGRAGVVLRPDAAPIIRLETTGPVALDLAAEPNTAFWNQLEELTGLELQDPEASMRIAGTWDHPEGELHLRAARIAYSGSRFVGPLPVIEDLALDAAGNAAGIAIQAFSLKVEGQPMAVTGRFAVPADGWQAVRQDPLGVLRRGAEMQLTIDRANLAAFSRLAPEVLAPQGELSATLSLQAGGDWNGNVRITDATTRRLGAVGALHEINAELRFQGDRVDVTSASALLGGQPVTLQGSGRLPLSGSPSFSLSLNGQDVPLVREAGFLLRGDLDLQAVRQGSAPPRVSGSVVLRDGLFLSDVRALLRTGPRGGGWGPQDFEIEQDWLRDWQIDVTVRGDRFLRMRTALFNGVASTRFQVAGTAGDPRINGDATIESGQILLPFARFDVSEGRVSLTPADPLEPQVAITASARRYGYDLQMTVSGPASNPVVQFTSTPPLSSEQVLLLVMTGELPDANAAASNGRRVAQLGSFLGQRLLNDFGGEIPGEDRLHLSIGDNISRLGRETYNLEYDLNDRWSLVGEYDEYDNFNAGVRWRVISKGGEGADAPQ